MSRRARWVCAAIIGNAANFILIREPDHAVPRQPRLDAPPLFVTKAYGWGPDTETSDGEYYYDGFDSSSPEEQGEIESRALMGAKVGNFMSLLPQVVEEAGFYPYESSVENIGDFLTVLNDEMKWPLAKIAERLKQSGL